jgi:hypothetical protein
MFNTAGGLAGQKCSPVFYPKVMTERMRIAISSVIDMAVE